WDMYGSTEAHMVAARRLDVDGEDAPAFIVPGARVEVVDENDEPLPDGANSDDRHNTAERSA
ncbi:MAG TPA: hypothetical protein VKY66_07675, partial [Protaetiibacter sp.]|nr:hypothetical protein [Protaetiibacter sp.]